MSKLNIIKELRTIYNNMENKKVEYDLPTGKIEFEVKSYLPYEQKVTIINGAIEAGFDVDVKTVLPKFEFGNSRIIRDYLIIKHYTDIPVLDDVLETYNLFEMTGLRDFIMKQIDNKELLEIERGIEEGIGEFYRIQELSTSLGHKLDGLVEMINGSLNDTLNGFKDLNVSEIVAKQTVANKQIKKLEKNKGKVEEVAK